MARRKLNKEERKEVNIIPPNPASKEEAGAFLQQVWNNVNIHGTVLGAVVQVNLNGVQETTIFFSDGFVFGSELPLLGVDIDKEPKYRFNVLSMKEIVMMIPFLGKMVEGDYVSKRATAEELKDPQSYGLTCYFTFRPPETGMVNHGESLGIWLLDHHICIIAEDEFSEFMAEVGATEV